MFETIRSKCFVALLVVCVALTTSDRALALSTDKDQPIEIEADRVEVDERTGISTFRGNVRVTQGSIRMESEMAEVYRAEDGGLEKVIATGNPATYRQRPDNKDSDVVARAKRMEYHAKTERVVLQDKAEVTQEGNQFAGNRIEYDIKRDRVVARKAPDGGERVKIVIPPKKKKTN